MNRIIKFRIWHKKDKRFLPLFENVRYYIEPTSGLVYDNKHSEFLEDCIVQQFTGLVDGENKEIFDGDIIEKHTRVCSERGEFEDYTNVETDFVKWGKHGWKIIGLGDFDASYRWPVKEWKVVGNILENPEIKMGKEKVSDDNEESS